MAQDPQKIYFTLPNHRNIFNNSQYPRKRWPRMKVSPPPPPPIINKLSLNVDSDLCNDYEEGPPMPTHKPPPLPPPWPTNGRISENFLNKRTSSNQPSSQSQSNRPSTIGGKPKIPIKPIVGNFDKIKKSSTFHNHDRPKTVDELAETLRKELENFKIAKQKVEYEDFDEFYDSE